MKAEILKKLDEIKSIEASYISVWGNHQDSQISSIIEEMKSLPEYCFEEATDLTTQFGRNNQYVMF